jgi:hypothetical protein
VLHLLAATAAEEGKKVILVVFLAVVTLGELTHWLRSRH